MSERKMTPAMRRGLEWFADQYGAVQYFDRSAPRASTRIKLVDAGLVRSFYSQRTGKMCFAINDDGLAALGKAAFR